MPWFSPGVICQTQTGATDGRKQSPAKPQHLALLKKTAEKLPVRFLPSGPPRPPGTPGASAILPGPMSTRLPKRAFLWRRPECPRGSEPVKSVGPQAKLVADPSGRRRQFMNLKRKLLPPRGHSWDTGTDLKPLGLVVLSAHLVGRAGAAEGNRAADSRPPHRGRTSHSIIFPHFISKQLRL